MQKKLAMFPSLCDFSTSEVQIRDPRSSSQVSRAYRPAASSQPTRGAALPGHPVSSRLYSPAFVVVRLIRPSVLVYSRASYVRSYARTRAREIRCARDSRGVRVQNSRIRVWRVDRYIRGSSSRCETGYVLNVG